MAEKRGGQAVLCGRIFALWMTPVLGSWNWFPHAGFWFLYSLLLLHVAAVFLLCSLDQDETERDSALFLLHLPSHASTLNVGLPLSIT